MSSVSASKQKNVQTSATILQQVLSHWKLLALVVLVITFLLATLVFIAELDDLLPILQFWSAAVVIAVTAGVIGSRPVRQERRWHGVDWWIAIISGAMLSFFVVVAFIAEFLAPYEPKEVSGLALLSPGEESPQFILITRDELAYEDVADIARRIERVFPVGDETTSAVGVSPNVVGVVSEEALTIIDQAAQEAGLSEDITVELLVDRRRETLTPGAALNEVSTSNPSQDGPLVAIALPETEETLTLIDQFGNLQIFDTIGNYLLVTRLGLNFAEFDDIALVVESSDAQLQLGEPITEANAAEFTLRPFRVGTLSTEHVNLVRSQTQEEDFAAPITVERLKYPSQQSMTPGDALDELRFADLSEEQPLLAVAGTAENFESLVNDDENLRIFGSVADLLLITREDIPFESFSNLNRELIINFDYEYVLGGIVSQQARTSLYRDFRTEVSANAIVETSADAGKIISDERDDLNLTNAINIGRLEESGDSEASVEQQALQALSESNLSGEDPLVALVGPTRDFVPLLDDYDNLSVFGSIGPEFPNPILGTNSRGEDVLSRIIYGSRTTLIIGIGSAIFSCLVGIPIGLISGYIGGFLDRLLSLIMDSLYSFPGLILAIAIASVLGRGLFNVILAISVIYVPIYYRIVRSQTLSIREMAYVEAAKSLGARNTSILLRYIFPNVIASVVVIFSINVADAILTGAGLSFLGLGLPEGTADWGLDLAINFSRLRSEWWLVTFPGLAITILVLCFSLLGESLSEILNPRLNRA